MIPFQYQKGLRVQTVSYTHLDVYKRQLQAGAFNYTLNRDSDEDWYLRSENAYRAEAVSYTHLDVYKRQAQSKPT